MDNEQLKLENQLCFRLYSAARLTMGAYHPYLDPLGITYPQYLVLLVLWVQDKQPVCDIGKRLMLDTNTMTPEQVVKAAKLIRPKVLFPYHYSETDLTSIPAQLNEEGIDVRIRHYE